MSKASTYFSLVFLLLFWGCQRRQKEVGDWRATLSSTNKIDANQRANALLSAAAFYKDSCLNKTQTSDSLIKIAIKEAVVGDNAATISYVYTQGIRLFDWIKEKEQDKAGKWADIATENAQKANNFSLENLADVSIARYYLTLGQVDKSRPYINKILGRRSQSDGDKIIVSLLNAEASNTEGKSVDQLTHLLDALYLSAQTGQDSLQVASLWQLSDFYLYQKKYKQAVDYLEDAKSIIVGEMPVDSTKYFWNELFKLVLVHRQEQWETGSAMAEQIFDYASRKNQPLLGYNAQSELRSAAINSGDFGQLNKWYSLLHPQELAKLKEQNKGIYFRVLGYIAENNKDIAAAKENFDSSAKYLDPDNLYYNHNFYWRVAEFYNRIGDTSVSFENYKKAYLTAKQTGNVHLSAEVADTLNKYHQRMPVDERLQFFSDLIDIKSSMLKNQQNEKINQLELQNVLTKREIADELQLAENERRHKLQLQIISLVALLILMTMVLLSNFKLPRWWIRSMGYVSFIIVFELIIFLLDGWLHHITHGEPWKILSLKVLIIAFMMPLHHWMEHKIVRLLLKHNIISEFIAFCKDLIKHKKEHLDSDPDADVQSH